MVSRLHSSSSQDPLLQVVVAWGQEAQPYEEYSSWYWPMSHVVHGSSPSDENVPGKHRATGSVVKERIYKYF